MIFEDMPRAELERRLTNAVKAGQNPIGEEFEAAWRTFHVVRAVGIDGGVDYRAANREQQLLMAQGTTMERPTAYGTIGPFSATGRTASRRPKPSSPRLP